MLKRNEDLFAESSMSFGDHLEELRVCLWRAIIWLVVGFVIGLGLSGYVVAYIQKPLEASLTKFHSKRGEEILFLHKSELVNAGYPFDLLVRTVRRGNLLPEINYIFSGQLEGFLDKHRLALGQGVTVVKPAQRPVDEVDNLNQYARSPERTIEQKTGQKTEAKSDEAFSPHVHIDQNVNLFPLVMFRELGDLSVTRSRALGVHEPFMIFIKAALVVGFVVASPGIFYSIWSFVAAGLYYHERKYVYIFMPFSILLFIAGAALAFFVVFRYVLDFLFAFNAWMNIDPDTRISEWMSFALLLPIGFGISFQLPLVLFVLERVGILSIEMMISKWKIAVLIIFVISMILTPSDPQSLVLMAIPLTILYFFGIALCYVFPKKKSEFDE